MDKQIKLSGSNQEQANQLWNILKDRHLSAEEIQALAPVTKEFIQALGNCIQRQIESEEKNYQQFQATMQAIVALCNNALKDNVVSQQERKEIFELLDKLSERMRDVQINKQDNDSKFKKYVVSCVAALCGIVILRSGRGGGNGGGIQNKS